MQYSFFTVNDERVAGVMAALKADYQPGLLGQQIDNLAFAFVAPLRTNHHHVCRHLAILQ